MAYLGAGDDDFFEFGGEEEASHRHEAHVELPGAFVEVEATEKNMGRGDGPRRELR